MQTIAQLDGDIVTRIQRGREAAAHKPLHELHNEAVACALEHWQFLAQTVATFFVVAASGFFWGNEVVERLGLASGGVAAQ